jgi:hypothetical protein
MLALGFKNFREALKNEIKMRNDKLVCINNKPIHQNNPFNISLSKLVEWEIYTVEKVIEGGYVLVEVKSTHPCGGFDGSRFRKVDFIFGEEVCNEILEQIKEELVCV